MWPTNTGRRRTVFHRHHTVCDARPQPGSIPIVCCNFDCTILMPPGRLRYPWSCYTYSYRHHYPRRYPIRVHLHPFRHWGPKIVHLFASNIPLLVKIIDFDVVFFCFFQNTAQKLAFYSVPKFRNLTELFRRNPGFKGLKGSIYRSLSYRVAST